MAYKTQTTNSCGAWSCYYYWWEKNKKTYDPMTATAEVEGTFYKTLIFDATDYPLLSFKGFCDPIKIEKRMAESAAMTYACYLCASANNLEKAAKDKELKYVGSFIGKMIKNPIWNTDGMALLKSNQAEYVIGIYKQDQGGMRFTIPKSPPLSNQIPLHYALTKFEKGTCMILDSNFGYWQDGGNVSMTTWSPLTKNYSLQYTGLSIVINE